MSDYLGDFYLGANIDTKFTTVNTSGVPTMLSGSPAIVAYPDNSTTEITAGLTLTTNFDGRSGLNHIRVAATSGNGYATGTNYSLILVTGTVAGSFVGGYTLKEFSIEARAALRPASDGRDIVLSSAGFVDINDKTGFGLSSPQAFDLIGNISGTHVGNQQGNILGYVGSVTGSVLSVTNPVTVGTNNDKTGYSLSSPQNFNLIGNISGTFVGNISGTVGAVNGLVPSRLDVAVSSRMATGTLVNANLKQIDGLATNGNNATLKLKSLDIQTNDGTLPVNIAASSPGQIYGVRIVTAGGTALYVEGGEIGAEVYGGTDAGAYIWGAGSAAGLDIQSTGIGKSINAPSGILGDIVGNITGTLVGNIYGNVTGTSGIRTGTVIDAVAGLNPALLDVAVSSRLASGTFSANYVTPPTANENADALLKRDWNSVAGEAARSVLNALRKLRNKVSFDGVNALTTTKEDDSTPAYTQSITTDDNQEPFKSVG